MSLIREHLGPPMMTHRARAYLVIVGARCLALAVCCLAMPGSFRSPSYEVIKQVIPSPSAQAALAIWGVVFGVGAILAVVAAVAGNEDVARWALVVSALTSSLWVGGFFAAMFTGTLTGPTGPIVWGAVVLKDLTMLRQPLRNPFEPLIRKVADETSER